MTMIAIITRTKDRPILLDRAVRSVLNQKFDDWVHVIVNDGGEKKPVDDLLNQYRDAYDNRLICIHNISSVGMEAASNIGIKNSQSEYLVIHDDDDSWATNFLSEMLSVLEEKQKIIPKIGAIACHSVQVYEKIDNNQVLKTGQRNYNFDLKNMDIRALAQRNLFPPISFIFKRDIAENLGLFREDLPVLGDWDFHLRFALAAEITVYPKALAYYHHRKTVKNIYGNSISAGEEKHIMFKSYYVNEHIRQNTAIGQLFLSVGLSNEYEDNRFKKKLQKNIRSLNNKFIIMLILLIAVILLTWL